ncbi:hypothetical protein Taro_037896 [Colocasia esculenta]|uniref:GDT1 family protein n=1 Tax=Colocasia esculenta TaxID=4460 RepID=A0A843W1V9_COLES|nr:hypothetical protein [Colocasia esculenta]
MASMPSALALSHHSHSPHLLRRSSSSCNPASSSFSSAFQFPSASAPSRSRFLRPHSRDLLASRRNCAEDLIFDDNKLISETIEDENGLSLMHDTRIPGSEECRNGPFDRITRPNLCFSGGLKLALLSGFLTFQDLQHAVAATEFANGLQPIIGDLGDIGTGFASAFLLIFFSELGDKTFFIAALLAARNSGAVVFTGTFGALAAMTMISVFLGRTFHYVDGILPFRFGETDLPVDDIAAVCLLVYFGVSTLIEASSGDSSKSREEQEEAEIAVSELSGNGAEIMTAANTVISTFALVFVAEWGDKSFFSTIALAAASSPLGVIGGALAGHAVATLVLAVVGGSIFGTFFSEKVIAYVGGFLFLAFAAVTLIEIVS